jgi:hypothetical protein
MVKKGHLNILHFLESAYKMLRLLSQIKSAKMSVSLTIGKLRAAFLP